ncbi:DUF4192 family protein [Actinoplanes sp. TBRC 11911]|uniref:DUF4192 family protein n=1 Tax=Actinoplanes sp. TBRC 11911 TaxID=2729386 RepID=UPI00145DEF04|nr:DUF4192 family protein [Actinoplanes sp. TBRC 11911]NMO57887.1 DUF4192 family protein [Actinoplanes sp. TBRC 11911]
MTDDSIIIAVRAADVVGIAPTLLNFQPEDSLVVVGLQAVFVIAAASAALPEQPGDREKVLTDAKATATALKQAGATTAVMIGYGESEQVSAAASPMADALSAAGVEPLRLVRVENDRIFDLGAPEPSAFRDGARFDPRVTATPVNGRMGLPDHDGIAVQLAPTDGVARAEFSRATEEAGQRLFQQVEQVGRSGGGFVAVTRMLIHEGKSALGRAFESYREGSVLDNAPAAELVVLVNLPPVFNLALQKTTDQAWQIRMWTDLLRRAELEHVPAVAVVLAVCALHAGNGALARAALARALDARPGDPLAQTLIKAIDVGLTPDQLASILSKLPSDS